MYCTACTVPKPPSPVLGSSSKANQFWDVASKNNSMFQNFRRFYLYHEYRPSEPDDLAPYLLKILLPKNMFKEYILDILIIKNVSLDRIDHMIIRT